MLEKVHSYVGFIHIKNNVKTIKISLWAIQKFINLFPARLPQIFFAYGNKLKSRMLTSLSGLSLKGIFQIVSQLNFPCSYKFLFEKPANKPIICNPDGSGIIALAQIFLFLLFDNIHTNVWSRFYGLERNLNCGNLCLKLLLNKKNNDFEGIEPTFQRCSSFDS